MKTRKLMVGLATALLAATMGAGSVSAYELSILSDNTHLFEGSNPAFFDHSLIYEDEPRAAETLKRSNGQFAILGYTEVWADKMRTRFADSLAGYRSYIPQADWDPIKIRLAGSPGMVLSVKGEWAHGPSFGCSYYEWSGKTLQLIRFVKKSSSAEVWDKASLEYRKDSRLLIINGSPGGS